jgi:hypothetical protein
MNSLNSNAALHRIAVTQIRLGGLGKTYYDKQLAAGSIVHLKAAGPE